MIVAPVRAATLGPFVRASPPTSNVRCRRDTPFRGVGRAWSGSSGARPRLRAPQAPPLHNPRHPRDPDNVDPVGTVVAVARDLASPAAHHPGSTAGLAGAVLVARSSPTPTTAPATASRWIHGGTSRRGVVDPQLITHDPQPRCERQRASPCMTQCRSVGQHQRCESSQS